MHSAATRTARAVILPAALIINVCLLALACDGGKGDGGSNGGNDGGPVSFDVTMGDNYYQPNVFTVKAGQKVTFHFKNEGAAIHNMLVAGADNKYNTEDDTLSEPRQIRSGGTGVLEWTAPEEAAVIKVRCEFHPTDSTGTIKVGK